MKTATGEPNGVPAGVAPRGSLPSFDRGTAELLNLLRRSGPLTRAEMLETTGWARVTVTSRIEHLLQVGLVAVDGSAVGARGRPAARYRIDAARAVHLVADVGAQGMRLARVDLDGRVEEARSVAVDVARGPETVLREVRRGWDLLADQESSRPVWGAAVSLPGPVDFNEGRIVSPPIMTGWDGFPVRSVVGGWLDCPVLVENDVNAMVMGELTRGYPDTSELLVVKVGTGVGCGIISGGRVVRGAAGAAGDIGHTWAEGRSPGQAPPECRCGKRGCLEAYVGGWALARDLGQAVGRTVSVEEVRQLLQAGDPTAVRLTRDAGELLGASLAAVISLLNPSAVVLSGQIAIAAGDHLLAGVRQQVYARTLPLATRDLSISVSRLWPDSGVHGLARGIGDLVFSGQ